MNELGYLGATFAISFASCLLFVRLGPSYGLVDAPRGRKDHARPVAIGGGLALYVAMITGCIAAQLLPAMTAMVFAASIIVVAGFADDLLDVSPKVKFLAQAAASLVMIFGAEVQLRGVGNLLGFGDIGLSVFVVPVTILATLGVINALNMADGMDGLAGTMGLIAFATFALVAREQGLGDQAGFLALFAIPVFAFLTLNMRIPGRPQGIIFLGDAGSMLLGFVLAWFAIDLTQGPGRKFPEICALWVVVVPLCDCVSLMVRRVRARTSPFVGDRQHLHHFLLDRGFSVLQVQAIIGLASLICAAVGYFGWRFQVPENILFAGFVALFIIYHQSMKRAFQAVASASD